VRVHRPKVDELLTADEAAAVHEVFASMPARLGDVCPGARVVWATCDADRAPARLGLGAGRLVNLRLAYSAPTATRLGLHAWTDTVEAVVEAGNGARVAFVAHEVEKLIRMATRQAWFPLALQAGAELAPSVGVFRELPERVLTLVARGSCQTLVDLARGMAAEGARGDAARVCLAALRLGRSSMLCLHVSGQFTDADDRVDPARLLQTAQAVADESELPERPVGYDDVSAWLVACRLEESRGAW
jgi:hypothetical protein